MPDAVIPQIGKGTQLTTSTTQNGAYTALAGVKDAKDPKRMLERVETTQYSDPTIQRAPGWEDDGEVEFKINYTYAQAVAINVLFGVVGQWYKVVKPDGSGWNFQGWIGTRVGDNPIKAVLEDTVTIVVTSVPTLLAS
jgi:hypothetical protein